MNAAEFLRVETLLILGLGLVAFVMDTVGGVMIAKLMNLFLKEKINPMIGAAGISAFPMSARVVHKMGLAEDKQNFLLMHAAGRQRFRPDRLRHCGRPDSGAGRRLKMELHVDYLMNVLPIVGTGMLGVFLVTGVIIAGVSLLNALTSKKEK